MYSDYGVVDGSSNDNDDDDVGDNIIAIVYGTRLSSSHSLQVFHRVIYCIITEQHNGYTEGIVYVRGDMCGDNVRVHCTFMVKCSFMWITHIKSFLLVQISYISHRQNKSDNSTFVSFSHSLYFALCQISLSDDDLCDTINETKVFHTFINIYRYNQQKIRFR